jgi:hypothetical protein
MGVVRENARFRRSPAVPAAAIRAQSSSFVNGCKEFNQIQTCVMALNR